MDNAYEPKSRAAEEVLLGPYFRPYSAGYLTVDTLIRNPDVSEAELERALREFEADGLVTRHAVQGVPGIAYAPTPAGWSTREALLRRRGLRHPALVRQREYKLADLILALIMAGHIESRRLTANVWAGDAEKELGELSIYLGEYAREHIHSCCNELVKAGMLATKIKYGTVAPQPEPAWDVTGRGAREYRTSIAPHLGLTDDESILDFAVGKTLVIFNAWQSEFSRSHSKIDEALERVVKALNESGATIRQLEIVQATQPGDGAIRIDVALQERIKSADFFIGDMTPVYAYNGRLRVNENVLVEVGFALASKQPSEVILLAMRRDDVPGEPGQAKPAFDIAHVRRLEFSEPAELRRRLQTELVAALRARGYMHPRMDE